MDHHKLPYPRTLRQAYASGPMVVLGGGGDLISEVTLSTGAAMKVESHILESIGTFGRPKGLQE